MDFAKYGCPKCKDVCALHRAEIERLKKLYSFPRTITPAVMVCNHFLSFLDTLEQESTPKIKGYVARDEDGTLHFFSSECGDGEPIYDKDSGTWGLATGEMIELPHQSGPFGDLSYLNDPIEVELEIHRV